MDFDSVRMRLEIAWIRVRSWVFLARNLAAIGLFLVGVYAVYEAYQISGGVPGATEITSVNEPNPELAGWQVPALFGLSAYETLLYGGILLLMIGLGLSYRWIISDSALQKTYP